MAINQPYRTSKSSHVPKWPIELNHFTVRDIEWCFNFFNNSPRPARSTIRKNPWKTPQKTKVQLLKKLLLFYIYEMRNLQHLKN